ncbi:MAG TPA: hypothetical protein DCO75_08350 [Fibrobacteres bacterium]|nr:hypothetical protein [Fibrobacterota bacterium]
MKYYLKRFKNDCIYFIIVCLVNLHRFMPRRFGLWFAAQAGKAFYCLPTKDRGLTLKHLEKIFGSILTQERINSCAENVYADLGKNAFDALYLARLDDQKLARYVVCDDLSEFRNAHARGNGIMAITAHCGCFEMLLHYFAAQGFPCFAIGSKLYDGRLDKFVSGLRSGKNIAYLHRSDNLRGMIRLLKEGRVMGALIDQDTNVDGIFAHFLGSLAYTPSGAVKLARRNNIPVFVVTTARLENNKHEIFISKEIRLHEFEDETEDCVRAIEIINSHISSTIERFPSQWVWMHRRWKKRPDDAKYSKIPNIENYI